VQSDLARIFVVAEWIASSPGLNTNSGATMFKRRKEPQTATVKSTRNHERPKPDPAPEPFEPQTSPAKVESRITAMIGATIKIKGEISGDENLTIDGTVEGKVDLGGHDLTIGTSGDVKANLTGKTVQINGSVTGDIESSELAVVSKSGRVMGNIVSPRVTLEDGAQFKGSIDMGSIDEKPANPATSSDVTTHPSINDNHGSRREAVA
jgi:cytoskeletal protein CcmA (bactofilin family)